MLTGAGISADSGVRTFRDAGGLWEGHRVEDVATPEAWRRAPETVWRFYQLRRAQLADVVPNAAHHALAKLEQFCVTAGGTSPWSPRTLMIYISVRVPCLWPCMVSSAVCGAYAVVTQWRR